MYVFFFFFKELNADSAPYHEEILDVPNSEAAESFRKYKICLTYTGSVRYPATSDWQNLDEQQIRALDLVTSDFARNEICRDNPEWYITGSKFFSAKGESFALGGGYTALRGTYSSIRSCLAGLVLCADMSVSCFLTGGNLINVMWSCALYNNADAMLKDAKERGLSKRSIELINDAIKNLLCRLIHLGHTRKIKCLGPPANSKESTFDCDGVKMTVADYYTNMMKTKSYFGGSKSLKFPFLPTVNVGSNSKPVLIPAELIEIRSGQPR